MSYNDTDSALTKLVTNYVSANISNYTYNSDVPHVSLFDLYEVYRTKEREQLNVYRSVAYVFGAVIFLSNLTVVVSSGLIIKKGQQPKSTYLLLGNVSLADTIIGISIIFSAIAEDSTSSNPLCIFQIGMLACPTMVSIFSVGMIAIDRYIYILHGLYYQRWCNTTKVRISIVCMWMVGITLGFMPATGWVSDEYFNSKCTYVSLYPGTLILINSFLSIIPIVLVAVLYSIILVKAVKNVNQINTTLKTIRIKSPDHVPEMRVYRGNGNKKLAQSVKFVRKIENHEIKRSVSFHTIDICKTQSKLEERIERSKSTENLCFEDKDDVNLNKDNYKTENKRVSDSSIFTISTATIISESASDVRQSPKKITKAITHCKTRFREKLKEPNKWRAIIIVLLTTGSFIFTWMPFFITVLITNNTNDGVTQIMARSVVFLLLLAVALVQSRHELYEGHELYRVAGPSQEIGALEAHLDIISATPAARSSTRQLEALVRLSPEDKTKWLQYFDQKQMTYTKIVDNLADILRDEEAKINRAKYAARQNGQSISWDTYYNSEEINEYLDKLGEEYPELVTVINPTLSYEGRQIKYVRISTTRFEDLRKPVIIIDAGVHAREWITPPVALYIIHQLVVNIVDENLTERLDWVIIPLANPDGYEFSIAEDRMWRKTRSKAHEGAEECPGVDGNRNFAHYWGTSEASANPCTLIYEGPTAFSEPEIRVIRDVVLQNLNRASMYISLHSFGNMFLYAWGNNGTLPSNGLILHLAGVRMATAIDKVALEKADPFIVGNAANVLYFTTGTSRDWTRAVGIPLTYTLELQDYGFGFLVPPEYIRQVVVETWEGIVAGAYYVLSSQ
ncbi:uncharacterized protein [Battus philenor]|uniref:uncharacterized protein n=1 Tax=Battus philenor TaxID=42288 RepID=UPI0035D0B862